MDEQRNFAQCLSANLESGDQAFENSLKSGNCVLPHESNVKISDVHSNNLIESTSNQLVHSYSSYTNRKVSSQNVLCTEATQNMMANKPYCSSSGRLSPSSTPSSVGTCGHVRPCNAAGVFQSLMLPKKSECKSHSAEMVNSSTVFPKTDASDHVHEFLTSSSNNSSVLSSGMTRHSVYVVESKPTLTHKDTKVTSHLVKISQTDPEGHELQCNQENDALASVLKFQYMEKQLQTSKDMERLTSSDGNVVMSTTLAQSPVMAGRDPFKPESLEKIMVTKALKTNSGLECTTSVTLDCEIEQPGSTTMSNTNDSNLGVTCSSINQDEDSSSHEVVSSSTAASEIIHGVADSSTPMLEHRSSRKSANKIKPVVNILDKIAALGTEPDRHQFLENLFSFMESRGTPVTVLPVICRQAVDLYRLYHLVKERGGMVEVSKGKRWRDVGSAIGIGGSTSAGFTLKRNYGKFLFPYECKFDRGDIDPAPLLAAMETPRKDSKRKLADKEKERDIEMEESQSSCSHASWSLRTVSNSNFLVNSNWSASAVAEQVCNESTDATTSVLPCSSSSTLLPCSDSLVTMDIIGHQKEISCAAGNQSSSSLENITIQKSEFCASSSYALHPLQNLQSSRLSNDARDNDFVRMFSPVASQSSNCMTLTLPNGRSEEVGVVGFQPSTSEHSLVKLEEDNSSPSKEITSEPEFKVEANDNIESLITPQLVSSRQAILATNSPQIRDNEAKLNLNGIKINYEVQHKAQLNAVLQISSTDENGEYLRANGSIELITHGQGCPNVFTSARVLSSSGTDSKSPRHQIHQDKQLSLVSQKNFQSNKADVTAGCSSRYNTFFPPDSIEAQQPSHKRRNLLTHKDIGPTDLWRVMMCLRSGLIAESTWAIDVLSVLLHGNSTASAICLDSLPGLLEVLLEYLRQYLIELFGVEHFKDLKALNLSSQTSASTDLNKSVENDYMTILTDSICRKRKASESNEFPPIGSVMPSCFGNLASDGETESSACNWEVGSSDTTLHIITHISDDDNSFREQQFFGKNYSYLKQRKPESFFSSKLPTSAKSDGTTNSSGNMASNDRIHKSSVNALLFNTNLDVRTTNSNACAFQTDIWKLRSLKNAEKNCSDNVSFESSYTIQKYLPEPKFPEDIMGQKISRFTCSHLETLKSISSETGEETCEPDDFLILCHSDSKAEIADRGLCISRIIRNLSLINGNEVEMSKNHGLILIISRLLLLHHQHRQNHVDCTQLVCNNIDETAHKWWWGTLAVLREHCLVILTSISGQLDLSSFPESICLPLLDSLLHWSICQSAEARDPLPWSTLSISHLVLETFSKLCIIGANVDMIIATPPFSRIVLLLSYLASCLNDQNPQVVRELSLGLLSRMVQANDSAARALALERTAVYYVFEFIEGAELQARMVASTQGIEILQDFPETIGTSVDMLCRAADVLRQVAQIPANRSILLNYQNRFLQLIMSQILDCKVTAILADVLGIINST